jgi:tetratricopeptide (TPR) repeat protein
MAAWTGVMLIGPRRVASLPAVTLFICTAAVVCAAIAKTLPPPQSEQTPETSSDTAVESLERALSEGKAEKAHDLLIQILKRPHLGSDLLLRVGIQFAERELYGEAAEAFQRCVQEHPAVFEAYYNLALAEVAQQKWTASLATLKDAPQRSKAEVLACSYLRGKIEDAQGRTVEAQRDFSTAFVGAPQNQTYGLELGLFYIRQHAYASATGVFERAARINPRSPFLLLGLSLARFLAGQQRQTVEDLKKLLAVEPDFSPAQLLMAFALFMDGKLEDAEKFASQALNSSNPSPYLYYLDASILVKLQSRQYDRIFQELQIAQRAIPSCGLCYLTESKAHKTQGNVAAAIVDLETAVQLEPDFPDAWYRLAVLYRSVGRSTDASRAEDHFKELKADKEERETQMLRENFLQTLSASKPAH